MIIRIVQAYDTLVLNRPKSVLVVLLSILIFFGYHTRNFKLDASADTLLLEEDVDLNVFRDINERYPSSELLIVTYTPIDDLFSDQALEPMTELREELKKVASVNAVFSILDAPLFDSSDADIQEMLKNMPSMEKEDVDRARAREELVNSPIYRDLIVSGDGKTTALLLEMAPNIQFDRLLKSRSMLRSKSRKTSLSDTETQDLERISAEYDRVRDLMSAQRHLDIAQIRGIIAPYRQYGTIYLGGLPMITDDMVTFVRSDLTVFGAGVLAFLILILTAIFRQLRWIALPLVSCFYSGLTMIGVLGLFGWMVTVISSNFLALMLIITISMNIHLIVRYRQLHRDNPDDNQLTLVRMTIHKMVKPCLYTALTTIIGFGSLVVSDIKPVIDFGLMMSAGLTVTFMTSFLLFPTMLLVIGKNETATTVEEVRFMFPEYLAHLTEFQGNKILVLALVLSVLSIAGISMLRVENSFINYFSEDTEIYQGLKLIDEELGGTTPVEVLIKFREDVEELTAEDLAEMTEEEIIEERAFMEAMRTQPELWFTPTKIQLIKKAHDYLDGLPEIGKVLSLASSVRVVEEILGKELEGLDMAVLYNKVPAEVKNSLINSYISIENNEARIVARVLDTQPDLRRKELLNKIHLDLGSQNDFDQLSDYKLLINDVTVSGLLVLYNNMLQSLFSSQIKSIGVVMLGIGIMFLVLFRSFALSIIGILPNLLGALVVLGVMGWAEIPMDMMTITIAAITIGIAVDNGIHYIYRFREEYALTGSYEETLHICHSNIGKAVFYTTMTIIFGFSILIMSNFIPTIYFGVLTGAAMFIALMAALTVLPKLILLWKPFGSVKV
jgi:predicted RND superfamily exporter protein